MISDDRRKQIGKYVFGIGAIVVAGFLIILSIPTFQESTPLNAVFVYILPLAAAAAITGWMAWRPKTEKKPQGVGNKAWAGFAVLAILYWFFGSLQWHLDHEDTFPFRGSLILSWLIIFTALAFLYRFLLGRSWFDALAGYEHLQPRDEREERIVNEATYYSFGVACLFVLALGTLLQFTPTPSKAALQNIFLGSFFLLLAVRGFFIWIRLRKKL